MVETSKPNLLKRTRSAISRIVLEGRRKIQSLGLSSSLLGGRSSGRTLELDSRDRGNTIAGIGHWCNRGYRVDLTFDDVRNRGRPGTHRRRRDAAGVHQAWRKALRAFCACWQGHSRCHRSESFGGTAVRYSVRVAGGNPTNCLCVPTVSQSSRF